MSGITLRLTDIPEGVSQLLSLELQFITVKNIDYNQQREEVHGPESSGTSCRFWKVPLPVEVHRIPLALA